MSLQVNSLNTAQNYSNCQMNTIFKANPVGATNAIEKTPTTDTFVKPDKNKCGLKVLLGGLAIGTVVLAWLKLRKPNKIEEVFNSKFKKIEEIRKNFSEIFEKDFTTKEADELAKKYKDICEIKEDSKFVENLFEQVKNDYGFKNSHVKLEFCDYTAANAPCWAGMSTDCGHKILIRRIDGNLPNRKLLFKTMFHEFKHQKQLETAIATNKFAYEMAIAYRQLPNQTPEIITSCGGVMGTIDSLMQQIKPLLKPEIDRVSREIGRLQEGSPLYNKGLEYIYATQNYLPMDKISQNIDKYYENILEKEAHNVGKLAREVFDMLS